MAWNPDAVEDPLYPHTSPVVTHALSIKEPYAWCVASGWKPVEVRSVPFPSNRTLPVWVAIHVSSDRSVLASDEMGEVASYDDRIWDLWSDQSWDGGNKRLFACSEIIGAMRIVGSVNGEDPTEEQIYMILAAWSGRSSRLRKSGCDPRDWVSDDGFNWIIDDVYRFRRPIVCKGALNVWAMNPELARFVNRELQRTIERGTNECGSYEPALVYEMPKGADARLKKAYTMGVAT